MPDELPIEVTCQHVHDILQTGQDGILIDCREPDEYAIAKIKAAKLLPMGQIPGRLAELDPYREQPIIIHCHHGGRSLRVAQWLREQGFRGAQSMAGGIDEWSQLIDPSVPRY